MRNATCARTETSKLPTKVALLYGSLFYDQSLRENSLGTRLRSAPVHP